MTKATKAVDFWVLDPGLNQTKVIFHFALHTFGVLVCKTYYKYFKTKVTQSRITTKTYNEQRV